jgi:pimeloyl-ACP methyl ester carboxylesterase
VKSVVLVAVVAFAACGGEQHPHHHVVDADDDLAGGSDVESGPFHGVRKFVPTSFSDKITGSGRPIIFIPGLGCPGDIWDETVAHLGSGYEAHVLTLSGFAGRPPIKGPLVKTVRRELVHYIRARGLDQPILVGHSLGGFLAYWVAEAAPSRVGPVIVVDAGPALSETDEDTGENLRKLWTQTDDAQFVQQVHEVFGGMAADSKRMGPVIDEVAKSDRQAMGDAVYELTTTDLREKVAKITSPVLVVLADGMFQQQITKQIEVIPDHQSIVIPHTRHFVMFDDPPAFFKAIDTFLAAHPGH